MDWLKSMGDVIEYIEENLTQEIRLDRLSKIVGYSAYEFSRVFSFMVEMSVFEYIRRRKLSQAVFDIQNNNEKIIDIALKYGYESQAAFSRAFKEIHQQTPIMARKKGIPLKSYPKITFKLIIKGVNELNFRIEEKESFNVIGFYGGIGVKNKTNPKDDAWGEFFKNYCSRLWNNGGVNNYFKPPFWQVSAIDYKMTDGKMMSIIGAELKDNDTVIDGMDIKTIPAATWVVFTIKSPTGNYVPEAYTSILTEWLPSSCYKRNEKVQHLEVYPDGDSKSHDYEWEIWLPVIKSN